MKVTGIVRRVDDMGRVVIPQGLRRQFGIREGDQLEFFIDSTTNTINIKKSSTFEDKKQLAAEFIYDNIPQGEVFFQLHGRTTTCVIIRDGRCAKVGAAQCNMNDQFSNSIGKAIALARALGKEVPKEFLE